MYSWTNRAPASEDTEPVTIKRRAVRAEQEPPAEAVALRALMGSAWLTRDDLEEAAHANHDRFGWWGVSVFVAVDRQTEQELLSGRFSRSPRMAHLDVSAIREAGLQLLPTGKSPHHDVVIFAIDGEPSGDDLALSELLDRLVRVRHTVKDNPFHTPSGGSA
jgi:hypothetical protein